MKCTISGIDVHKRVLNVVLTEVGERGGEYDFERLKFLSTPKQLREMAELFIDRGVQEVVMESTAQYWRPVWEALERYWQPVARRWSEQNPMSGSLHLAQAHSNRARKGRKDDFRDTERLIRRYVADELVLSFVPSPEQRLWRTVTHRRQQCVEARASLQNQMEAFLEEAHIKLSSMVSDLLGQSGRRMLEGIAEGKLGPAEIALLADRQLRATPEQLTDALSAVAELNPVYRKLLRHSLNELALLDSQIADLEKEIAMLLGEHQEAVHRLGEIPGVGPNSAHQIIAEIGPAAATFPSAKELASWVGVCPGENVSAGIARRPIPEGQ